MRTQRPVSNAPAQLRLRPDDQFPPVRMGVRFFIFGDSIAAGVAIHDGTTDDAWPYLAAKAGGFAVINRSRGGRPTASIDEFDEVLKELSPQDILVLSLGANDARDVVPGVTERACSNISIMIGKARAKGIARIILIAPTNIKKESLEASYSIRHEREANLIALNTAYKVFAGNENVEFHTFYGVLPDDTMSVDGVHPDRNGNALLAESFNTFLAAHRTKEHQMPSPGRSIDLQNDHMRLHWTLHADGWQLTELQVKGDTEWIPHVHPSGRHTIIFIDRDPASNLAEVNKEGTAFAFYPHSMEHRSDGTIIFSKELSIGKVTSE